MLTQVQLVETRVSAIQGMVIARRLALARHPFAGT